MSVALSQQLTNGHHLKCQSTMAGWMGRVIEVTQLPSKGPIKWKLIRELRLPSHMPTPLP
jgi:hypothetical protein